jgi:poly(beta-D-mannuronate) lyase
MPWRAAPRRRRIDDDRAAGVPDAEEARMSQVHRHEVARLTALAIAMSAAALSACANHAAAGDADDDAPVDAAPPAVVDASPEDAVDASLDKAAACVHTVDVATTGALATAIAAAKPGDCIVLADGTYGFPTIKAKGTTDKPIVISAKHRGKATVASGNLVLDGAAFVTVEGLSWTSAGSVRVTDADHCRITRTRFHPTAEVANTDWISVTGTSDATRIDHNELGPKHVISNIVMLSGHGSQIVTHTRIDHNYFHDVVRTTGNGWETIRAGLSGLALSSSHTVIEANLFERCDGDPETISIKSSDNIIRNNTLRATRGEITLRHGNRNQVSGNYILGEGQASTGGIRVCGQDHRIFDNYVEGIDGLGVFLESGDSDAMNEAGTAHYRVYRAQVVFNTIVGSDGIANGGAHTFAPVDSVIANNLVQGPSGHAFTQKDPVTPTYEGNIAHPTGGTSVGMTVPASAVRVVDPKLQQQGGVWRLSATSPAIDAAVGSWAFVTTDIDGEPRSAPDVGCDERSSAPGHGPLVPADVGPDAP